MAEEKVIVKLKSFEGDVIYELKLKVPLQFPYLLWKDRLFVNSRDEANVMLERSYHALVDSVADNEKH